MTMSQSIARQRKCNENKLNRYENLAIEYVRDKEASSVVINIIGSQRRKVQEIRRAELAYEN